MIPTPEEKAIELHKKFMQGMWKTGNPNHIYTHGKECALICVEEILSLDVWASPHNTPEGTLYWTEVKKCLEKM